MAFALSISAIALAADVPAIPPPPGAVAPPASFPSDGANGGAVVVTPPPPPVRIPSPPVTDPAQTPFGPPLGVGQLPDLQVPTGRDSAGPPVGDTTVPRDANGYNRPGIAWYQDIYGEMYSSYYYFGEIEKWAYNTYYNTYHADSRYRDVYDMYVYASYVRYYFQSYFWTYFGYNESGQITPKYYDFEYGGNRYHSYAWRGDFNYNYYYYIKPVYHGYLKYAARYHQRHKHDSDYNRNYGYGTYEGHGRNAKRQYQSYVHCLYGSEGGDTMAAEDYTALSLEDDAGL